MIKIRLSKFGKRNAPTYRIVVKEARSKRDGKYLDSLGSYNPTDLEKGFSYNKKSYDEWMKKGAQPTKAVLDLIKGKYTFKKYTPKKEEGKKEDDKNEQSS
ncbi:MAG: 30S ribosomal protein S16 [bacterium]